MSINQIKLVSAIMKELGKQKVPADVQTMNAVVNAANAIIAEVERPRVMADHEMSIHQWLRSDDTGISSEWLARSLFFLVPSREGYPGDPDDIGRCIRMLRKVVGAQEKFDRMKDRIASAGGPVWVRYLTHWDELEALYDQEWASGSAPKLYKRMRELQVEAEK